MTKPRKNHRIYVIGALFVAATLVIWVRLIQVQVFRHAHYRQLAENQWTVKKTIPAVRGGIFDREGRPLALSINSCSVSLHPQEVRDRDKVVRLLSKHLSVSSRELRRKIQSDKSFVWVKRKCAISEEVLGQFASLEGVGVQAEADRIYPYGSVGNKLIGFVGHDNRGMAGIEAALDEELSGVPGWEVVQRDGRYRSSGFYSYAKKKPVDGRHVILTIDVALQEIAENELARAVRASRANNGALILMHCRTGEILALAECPSAPSRDVGARIDSLWTIQSVSCVYEPGSTFKLITAAALLEAKKVNTFDVFDAENGRANLGVAVITDPHPNRYLTFREGFVRSSNIVMAKASLNLEPAEFFEFIRSFGFGSKTGIHLLGESPGAVAPIGAWSKRTQVTMAFGQEIAVTPLQMINAFAAVANGGDLMVPAIVKSVVDENTGNEMRVESVQIRRVISKATAEKLKQFCREVVHEGTGTNAAIMHFDVSGKTGTAQKASGQGYSARKYVSSFIGFAPHDEPRIVCLVLLDEPNLENRFGGVSAAPVFAGFMDKMANSSRFFDDVLAAHVVDGNITERDRFEAPNFLRMDRETAMERARLLSMNVLCTGGAGRVIAQDPDPGVAMKKDAVLRLFLGGDTRGEAGTAPDLRGLSLRVAKRRALEAGFVCRAVGSGVVTSQEPGPGELSVSREIKLYCKDRHPSTKRG